MGAGLFWPPPGERRRARRTRWSRSAGTERPCQLDHLRLGFLRWEAGPGGPLIRGPQRKRGRVGATVSPGGAHTLRWARGDDRRGGVCVGVPPVGSALQWPDDRPGSSPPAGGRAALSPGPAPCCPRPARTTSAHARHWDQPRPRSPFSTEATGVPGLGQKETVTNGAACCLVCGPPGG